jgi:hypothetical protein
VPIRPLVLVAALAGGDYLLWTWSSDGDSTTVALISGLALAPLILAVIWFISVTIARAVIMRSSRPQAAAFARNRRGRQSGLAKLMRTPKTHRGSSASHTDPWEAENRTGRVTERQASSEKIAA